MSLGLLAQDQYSLILAGALISITLNPLMFRLIGPGRKPAARMPAIWARLDRQRPVSAPVAGDSDRPCGGGRLRPRGGHIVQVARDLEIPHLVVESTVERVEELNTQGTPTLYGDAANSEVLTHAGLDRARPRW